MESFASWASSSRLDTVSRCVAHSTRPPRFTPATTRTSPRGIPSVAAVLNGVPPTRSQRTSTPSTSSLERSDSSAEAMPFSSSSVPESDVKSSAA